VSDEYKKYTAFLEKNIRESGIDDCMKKPVYREYGEKIRDAFWKEYPDSTREEAQFFVNTSVIRKILKEDLIWLMKWIADPTRIEPVHQYAYDFFKYGPDCLPKHYFDAMHDEQGGFLQFNPKATRQLILLPRGIGKTTVFHAGRAIHNIINEPDYKWLMVHADKKRVLGNLKQTRSFMFNGKLSLIFPNIFAKDEKEYLLRGSRITKEQVNLVRIYNNVDLDSLNVPDFERKEDTITLGGPGVSRTGWHFEGVLADDLVIDETSRSEENTMAIVDYIDELEGLEEYHIGRDYPMWLTGTHWWEKNAYHKMQGREDTSIFQMPAKWRSGNDVHFISKFLDEEKLAKKIKSAKVWGDSQYLMIPRKFAGERTSIGFDESRHVIVDPEGKILEELEKTCVKVQVCDPAYSENDKKEGDNKSRFTITNFLCDENTTYIYDGYSSFGESLDSVANLNLLYAVKNKIDFFTQDAQGQSQGALYDKTLQMLRMQIPYLRAYKFTSNPVTKTSGKINVALEVLQEYFNTDNIKVILTEENKIHMKKVINQLARKEKGFDIIDTLVYCQTSLSNNEIDRDNEVQIARSRHSLKHKMRKAGNKLLNSVYKRIA